MQLHANHGDDLNELSLDLLSSKHCLFGSDVVRGEPDMTVFKRGARLRQALWREARGLPIGSGRHPRTKRDFPVGSKVDVEIAKASGANFLSGQILKAVKHRIHHPEHGQMLREDRLWGDLLSSMPLCFNLLGELWDRPQAATRALRLWFPDVPGKVRELRFEWSPGRGEALYLGNKSAFDAAFLLALGDGTEGIVGVETKYHEHARTERPKKTQDPIHIDRRRARFERYQEIAHRAGIFKDGWEKQVIGTELEQIWLDHLLVLSMLQHPSGSFRWGRFVLVYAKRNVSFEGAAARYTNLLVDKTSFDARTIEGLLETEGALPDTLVSAFQERYLW